jgi:hypothetical protein
MSRKIVERVDFPCPNCMDSTKYHSYTVPSEFHIPGTPDWRKRLECVKCCFDFAESISHPKVSDRPIGPPRGHFDCL